MSTPTSPISRNPGLRASAAEAVRPARSAHHGRESKSVDRPDFREVFQRAARRIAEGQKNVDRALRAARRGTVSNEQLIVMQATVYRFTQEVEMASKLVDKATGALRQTLQSQQ